MLHGHDRAPSPSGAAVDLSVRHLTRFRYPEAAWDSFNELHLRPADDYRQTVLAFDLAVEPAAPRRNRRDYYGNVVHEIYLAGAHQLLRLDATSLVTTYPVPAPLPVSVATLPRLRQRFFGFLAPTGRVPLDRDWFATFGALPLGSDGELLGYLDALTGYLRQRFDYRPGGTDVDTPLADFARSGAGVCQDYSHAMLAICRSAGIPSRYVSGYVHSDPHGDEHLLGGEGSHAWIEAFLPGSGWVGFDPTNGRRIGEAHIKIGVGRDYDDVPPLRGLRRGGGEEALEVVVEVRRAEGGPPADALEEA